MPPATPTYTLPSGPSVRPCGSLSLSSSSSRLYCAVFLSNQSDPRSTTQPPMSATMTSPLASGKTPRGNLKRDASTPTHTPGAVTRGILGKPAQVPVVTYGGPLSCSAKDTHPTAHSSAPASNACDRLVCSSRPSRLCVAVYRTL